MDGRHVTPEITPMKKVLYYLGMGWIIILIAIIVVDGIYGLVTTGLGSLYGNLNPVRAIVIVLVGLPGYLMVHFSEKLK